MLKLLLVLLLALAGLTCILSVAGAIEYGLNINTLWVLSLANHFRMQYACIELVTLVVLTGILVRHGLSNSLKVCLLTILPFTLLNLSLIGSYWLPQEGQQTSILKDHLRIYLINLDNTQDFTPLMASIHKENPDIICVVEHNQALHQILTHSAVSKTWPHYRADLGTQLGLYSRWPVPSYKIEQVSSNAGVDLLATIQWHQHQMTLLLAHPVVPYTAQSWQRNQAHFHHWIQHQADYPRPLILLGDLNSTPWTPVFQRLLQAMHLSDSQQGFGIQPSWSVSEPLFALPIDHVLVGPEVKVIARRIGPEVGSDHRPVIVDLVMR